MNEVQNMLDAIRDSFTLAGGTPGLSALFLAGLLALWYTKNEQKKDTKMLFSYAMVVLLVIISPPYLYLVGRFFTGYALDSMYLWLLPLTPVMLKVFSDAAVAARALSHRFIFGLSAAALLLLAGTSSFQPESFQRVGNHYYIPDAELHTLEYLKQIREERGQEEMLIWGPEHLMEYARRYDGGLILVYGRDMWEGTPDPEMHQIYEDWEYNAALAMQNETLFLDVMGESAERYGCDLLILDKEPFFTAKQPWPKLIGQYVLQETLENELIYVFTGEQNEEQ
ncbi:MAG: hypothetical protein IKQ27_11365 [Lachnospiraceae bacterium]|nr:hypothetical protein [Lachnospiraceae bacterium]